MGAGFAPFQNWDENLYGPVGQPSPSPTIDMSQLPAASSPIDPFSGFGNNLNSGGGSGLPSWLGPVVGAGLGAAQGAFANPPQKQHVTGTNTNTQNQNQTFSQSGINRESGSTNGQFSSGGSYSPNLSPLQQSTINQLLKRSMSNLNEDPNLSGYRAQQLGEINQNADARASVLRNTLASRGLTYSPLASAEMADVGNDKFKAGVDLSNSIPLMRQQMLQQKLGDAVNTFRAAPYGYSTSQAGNQGQTSAGTQSTVGQGRGNMNANSTGTTDQTTINEGNRGSGAGSGGILGGIMGGLGKVLSFL